MIQAQQARWQWRSWWQWGWPSSLWHERASVNAIEICALRFNYLPLRFRRQGTVYTVYTIDRIWEQTDRRYYDVRCRDGLRRTLVHNLRSNTWYLSERGTHHGQPALLDVV
jgi:hypothetical protein